MNKLIITLLIFCAFGATKAQIAIKAETIYTVSGTPIKNGVVLIKNGKIENVGSGISIPSNYKVYEAKVLTPGLIDARSLVGISGAMNIPTDQDQLDKTSPIQPELRAIDAYNPQEILVKVVRDYGVTTIHTGHGVGALISGQTMVAKTKFGPSVESVTIQPVSMLAMTLESSVGRNFTSPGTSAKQMASANTMITWRNTSVLPNSANGVLFCSSASRELASVVVSAVLSVFANGLSATNHVLIPACS